MEESHERCELENPPYLMETMRSLWVEFQSVTTNNERIVKAQDEQRVECSAPTKFSKREHGNNMGQTSNNDGKGLKNNKSDIIGK